MFTETILFILITTQNIRNIVGAMQGFKVGQAVHEVTTALLNYWAQLCNNTAKSTYIELQRNGNEWSVNKTRSTSD
jgi:hypothetical protein